MTTHIRTSRVPLIYITATVALLSIAAGLWGQSAKLLGRKEVRALVAAAKTPADHEKLAAHFRAEAARLTAESREHTELAELYARSPSMHDVKHPNAPQTAAHCRTFAELYLKAANEAEIMAKAHEQMAQALR